jgi:SAM-dependent methyltransferase
MVSDLLGGSLEDIRVIDLACEEGLFGIELARRGAKVLGVEGRAGNVARAHFAKSALGLDSYEVVQDDVRNVTRDKYGEFDVVLNLGILYHLDAPDVFELVYGLSDMCTRFMFLSTHYGHFARRHHTFRGQTYWGAPYPEHRPDTTAQQRLALMRASLDNPVSFWPTLPSLLNLLSDAGFTSVLEARSPRDAPGEQPGSLVNLVAMKGERFEMPSGSRAPSRAPARWPEKEKRRIHPTQTLRGQLNQERAVRVLKTVCRRATRSLARGLMQRV